MTGRLTLDDVEAELDNEAGLLCTRRKLRRVDVDVRRYVAARFEGRRVEILDRNGRTYVGTVLVVSVTTSGAFSEAVTLRYDEAGLWPVTVSLATVDTIRELRPAVLTPPPVRATRSTRHVE